MAYLIGLSRQHAPEHIHPGLPSTELPTNNATPSFKTRPEVRHYIMRELLAGLFVNLAIALVLVILGNSVW